MLSEDARKRTSTIFTTQKGKFTTVEDFNILKVLGSGACGKVFLVE